jgi:PAS domain S-box-containing protein
MASPDVLHYGLDGDVWLRQYRRSVRIVPGLQAALSYFQELFELAPVAFVVTDSQLTITDANRQAVRLLNRSLSGLRGKPLTVFVSASERNVFRTMVTEILATADQMVRPLSIKPVRREEVDMMFTAARVRDDDGITTAIYWVFYQAQGREQVEIL